jgi:hypothetical protein
MELVAESLKVVAHLTDGTLVKGSTQDFHPDRAMFRIVLASGVDTIPVRMDQIKAVFFVKQLEGGAPRPRQKEFLPTDGNRGNGRPVAVLFRDGELMVGYTHSFNTERQGFFMLPADPEDNNLRIFVMKSAASAFKLGPAAEEFARTRSRSSESNAA